MSDERLWGSIKLFASINGVDVSKKRVTPRDMAGIRRVLSSLTDGDIARIGELADTYKNGR